MEDTTPDSEKNDARQWDQDFRKWINNPDKHDRPGRHPDDNHAWNTKPEFFIDIFKKEMEDN